MMPTVIDVVASASRKPGQRGGTFKAEDGVGRTADRSPACGIPSMFVDTKCLWRNGYVNGELRSSRLRDGLLSAKRLA